MFEASLSPQLQHIETLQEYSQDYILYKKKKNTDITLYVIFVKILPCKNFSRDIKRYLAPSYWSLGVKHHGGERFHRWTLWNVAAALHR